MLMNLSIFFYISEKVTNQNSYILYQIFYQF